MDLLLEKWKNFPEARQLGDESARFIRAELESTWGQSHLAVLSEEEAQKWILGVRVLLSLGPKFTSGPFKICHNILQSTIRLLKTKNKQDMPFLGLNNNYSVYFCPNAGVPYPMVLGIVKFGDCRNCFLF